MSAEPVSLPDHFFEGQDILADGDTRDAEPNSFGAADLMHSPCQNRSELSVPLSSVLGNIQSAPGITSPRGFTRPGGHIPRSAAKRRRSGVQSPCGLNAADREIDMNLQGAADASCSVLGLTASPKVDSLVSPLRRSPRLHATMYKASSPARGGGASTGLVSPDRQQSMPAQHQGRPGQSILGQLAESQHEEEQALQRLITPKKHIHQQPAAPGSSGRVMQALLSEEAEQAAALDQLLSPERRQAASHAASFGLSNAESQGAQLRQQQPALDEHNDVTRAGMYVLHSSILCHTSTADRRGSIRHVNKQPSDCNSEDPVVETPYGPCVVRYEAICML